MLATNTDRKLPYDNDTDDLVDYYKTDIVTAKDYYPFGMEMPGRSWTADSTDSYRFGFQGQEKDDEWSGNGNMSSTGFRQYASRLGRWLSTDPKADSFPAWSPYNSMKNNPLFITDEKGGSPSVATALLINGNRYGAVSAATEIGTQVATKTLNNVAKQVKEGKEMD